jgi:hypothetical protein
MDSVSVAGCIMVASALHITEQARLEHSLQALENKYPFVFLFYFRAFGSVLYFC